MYGCFLRPHREIRLLTGAQFDEDLQRITLSGRANKRKKVRVVSIPDFVRKELLRNDFLNRPPHYNIFSKIVEPLNECYFSLQCSLTFLVSKGVLFPIAPYIVRTKKLVSVGNMVIQELGLANCNNYNFCDLLIRSI